MHKYKYGLKIKLSLNNGKKVIANDTTENRPSGY